MTSLPETEDPDARQQRIVDTLVEAFDDLMSADPPAFRRRFRKMAADPYAFYRGSACLFYADAAALHDRWADDRTSRVWIQGDLHVENFGTYMDGSGILVFDVNDFDEAYLGHFTWELQRLVASIALVCWKKAISDDNIARLIEATVRSYVDQVRYFAEHEGDQDWSLRLDNTDGVLHRVLQEARRTTRVGLLDAATIIEDDERRFRRGSGVRVLDDDERKTVEQAFADYLETIPESKRQRSITYRVKDVVGRFGFGIGSAGLPAYNVLIEGRSQALENDLILSMKQGNVAALSRIVDDAEVRDYFLHDGHRAAVSQRALQAHADPLLGHTTIDGVGFVVTELAPHERDLEWDELNEPDDIEQVLSCLGRATAKVHCVSDEDSEQTLVPFQTEEALVAVIGDREDDLVDDLVTFGMGYAGQVREDHQLFVDAFRNGRIPGFE